MINKQTMFEIPAEPDALDPWEVYLDLYTEGDHAVAGVAVPTTKSFRLEMWCGDRVDVYAAILDLLSRSDIVYVPNTELQVLLDGFPCPTINMSSVIAESGIRKSSERYGVVQDVLAGRMGVASLQVGRSLVQMLLAAGTIHERAVDYAKEYLLAEWVWIDAIVTHYKGQWLLRPDGTYLVRIRGNSDVAEAVMGELGDELIDAQDDGPDLLLLFGTQ